MLRKIQFTMTETYSNTKERAFTHLTEIKKEQIALYIDESLPLREIAVVVDF